jgi:peptidoglycan/LPS O-acetylase OafA/YrhL
VNADTRDYQPQLDSLRAAAVLAVMVAHFAPRATARWPLGEVGVRLFFVLSGFLITRILLKCRRLIEAGAGAGGVTGRFYARRLLRLVPALYAFLLVTWLAGVPEVRDSLPWHATYLSNVYFARLGDWHGATSHLWSLAVEEQFYLFWPLLVFSQPVRRLNAALMAIVAVGPLFRLYGLWSHLSPVTVLVLPFGAADSLALGGLLASVAPDRTRSRLVAAGVLAGPLAVTATVVSPLLGGSAAGLITGALLATLWSLWFVWVIDRAVAGIGGPLGTLIASPVLRYLGRISYGLYLFHAVAPLAAGWIWRAFSPVVYPPNALVGVGLPVAITVLMASASWQLLESPLNRLKRRVPYESPSPSLAPFASRAVPNQ